MLAESGELEDLDWGCCTNLTSLKGLETLTITGRSFSINELNRLMDLQHLPKLSKGDRSLWDLAGLTSLASIASAADQITSLQIRSMPRLRDVSALRQLQRLESLVIGDCPHCRRSILKAARSSSSCQPPGQAP